MAGERLVVQVPGMPAKAQVAEFSQTTGAKLVTAIIVYRGVPAPEAATRCEPVDGVELAFDGADWSTVSLQSLKGLNASGYKLVSDITDQFQDQR